MAPFYNHWKCILTPFHCQKSWKLVLTFRSKDTLLWCDHPDEIFSAVLCHGTIHLLVWLTFESADGKILWSEHSNDFSFGS